MWMIELQRGRRNLNDGWLFKLDFYHQEVAARIGKKNIVSNGGDKKSAAAISALSIIDKADLEPIYTQTEFCEPAPIVEPTPENAPQSAFDVWVM